MTNDTQELKYQMDLAICTYIAACTGVPISTIDYSYINESIDDAIETLKLLDSMPAKDE